MSDIENIKQLLASCTPAEREELLAGGLTLRMIRGVIAQAAFDVEVVEHLKAWQSVPLTGDPPYDFLLRDDKGDVRVQVKLQRSKDGIPWRACEARKSFRGLPSDMYVVETQKTRRGKKQSSDTRPYRYAEFDVLAVALYPSTQKWDRFMYTVGKWLAPDPADEKRIFKYQPVANAPNEDWTDDFETAVAWFRSGEERTIRAK